jgi:chromosomal replication initiation ATPase DnaA
MGIHRAQSTYVAEANSLADRMLRALQFENKYGAMRKPRRLVTNSLAMEERCRKILRRFAGIYGVSFSDIVGRPKSDRVCLVRDAAVYWMRRRTGASLPCIGTIVGNRDHTSALQSIRRYPKKRLKMGRHVGGIS